MEAIVLAGGFGTRLNHIVNGVPKPMAPINGKPFLEYILDDLSNKGISKIIMAVGYKHELIIEYFGELYKGIAIDYSVEESPLFTGGAIKLALRMCQNQDVFVINGDTYFNVNLLEMKDAHQRYAADLTIATKKMFEFDRYGTVESMDSRIIQFKEKTYQESGFINAGVYLMNRNILEFVAEDKFSFETDFMEKNANKIKIFEYNCNGYFIDIGIPEDYYKAQLDFEKGVMYE